MGRMKIFDPGIDRIFRKGGWPWHECKAGRQARMTGKKSWQCKVHFPGMPNAYKLTISHWNWGNYNDYSHKAKETLNHHAERGYWPWEEKPCKKQKSVRGAKCQ